MEVGWKVHLESAPGLAVLRPRFPLTDLHALACEEPRRVEVVPGGITGEVRDVERVPVEIAAHSTGTEELRTGVCSRVDHSAVSRLDAHVALIEHGALACLGEIVNAGVLLRCLNLEGEGGQLVPRE